MSNVTNSTPETKQLCDLSPTELAQYRHTVIQEEIEMIVTCHGIHDVLKNLIGILSEVIYNDGVCDQELRDMYGIIQYHIELYLKIQSLNDLNRIADPRILKKMSGGNVDHELRAMRDIKTYQYSKKLYSIQND